MESYQRAAGALAGGAPAVIGCRRRSDSQVLLRFDALRYVAERHLIGIALNRLIRALTGLSHTDTQCGLKGFERSRALALFERVDEAGFLFDIELLLAARATGTPVEEVPVCVIYEDSKSTLHFTADAWRTFGGLTRIARRIRSGVLRRRERHARRARELRGRRHHLTTAPLVGLVRTGSR